MQSAILTHTLEDYLEAIYQIASHNRVARSMEIAERLRVKRSSVTVALRSLAEKGLINYQARSYVTLTPQGENMARCIDRRHHLLFELFTTVFNLPDNEADKAACSMEHGMSAEVCRKITAFLMTLRDQPASAASIREGIESVARTLDCQADCGYTPEKNLSAIKQGDIMDLNLLTAGQCGIVAAIHGSGPFKKRLVEMGIVRDQKITVVRAAPLDDPIEVQVRAMHLTLRRDEAANILVRKEP